jgi:HD-GYP domain-containing protein (c-di-GMP phosphodiesterase class II)
MVRLSDIVKQKNEPISPDGGPSDSIRLSKFWGPDSPEDRRVPSAGGDTPTPNMPVRDLDDIYLTARTYMEGVRSSVRNGTRLEFEPAVSLIDKITHAPEQLCNIYPFFTSIIGSDDDYYILQPIHTMIYALKIGWRMNYSRPKLRELGLATLMQNIGMFLVPDHIVNKTESLTASDIASIKKHPEMGKDILMPYAKDYPWLVETVYQHHEREDGQGYPRNLKGDEILEYAKVIGICDSYEAMTHNRPHRKALLQFASIRQLIESKERLFSPYILKVFLEEMTLYPIGSCIKLNNGAIGRVIRTNQALPLKPLIKLLYDGLGNRADTGEEIDMAQVNVLNVVDVVAEGDLPKE